jgi:hypothetical protein
LASLVLAGEGIGCLGESFFNGEGEIGCPPQKEKKGKVLLQGGLSAIYCGKQQEENQAPPLLSAREVWS